MHDVGETISDGQAVHRTLRGDRRAFATLVQRHQRRIYDLMLRMTGCPATAQELAQDAFLRAYERLGSLGDGNKFFSWLYSLSMNLCRDKLRRRKRNPVCTDQESVERWAALVPGPGDILAEARSVADLTTSIGQLGLEEREMLILRYRDDVPFAALAEIFGISEGAAKMRVRRSLDKLRGLLEDQGHALR